MPSRPSPPQTTSCCQTGPCCPRRHHRRALGQVRGQGGGPWEKSPHGLWEGEEWLWPARAPAVTLAFLCFQGALGVGGCDVLGHSSHWSFNETKPSSLEWSFQHLLMCPWVTGPELGSLGFSPKCLGSLSSQLGQASDESHHPWHQPGWGMEKGLSSATCPSWVHMVPDPRFSFPAGISNNQSNQMHLNSAAAQSPMGEKMLEGRMSCHQP